MQECKVLLPMLLALFLAFTRGETKEVKLSFAIVYNNVPYDTNLTTACGMVCHIEGTEKTILFDTGGDGSTLLSNMKKMGVNPKGVDLVFLSHIHGDHVGGLGGFLQANNDVVVYLPQSFPEEFKDEVKERGAEAVSIHNPVGICRDVYSTGELSEHPSGGIREQSLIVDTPKGLIIVTGCAHPGMVKIVERAQELLRDNLYLLLGGFHLRAYPEREVRELVEELKELGVERVGPSHCTGATAIKLFREAWGDNFLDLGCGAIVEVDIDESDERRQ